MFEEEMIHCVERFEAMLGSIKEERGKRQPADDRVLEAWERTATNAWMRRLFVKDDSILCAQLSSLFTTRQTEGCTQ